MLFLNTKIRFEYIFSSDLLFCISELAYYMYGSQSLEEWQLTSNKTADGQSHLIHSEIWFLERGTCSSLFSCSQSVCSLSVKYIYFIRKHPSLLSLCLGSFSAIFFFFSGTAAVLYKLTINRKQNTQNFKCR